MHIQLQRLDNQRHRLGVRRDDGSVDEVELETRSVLLHDLVHYAVEAELPIAEGFWGTVARGASFAALVPGSAEAPPDRPGLGLAESLVGPMQSVWGGRLSEERYLELAGHHPGVDEGFIARVRERLRRLQGQWRATGFHEVMELRWPPAA